MNQREQIFYDIVIIGAGPAGLSAAIAIKQQNADLSVAIFEKGAEIGSHIISGAILDPHSLNKILPNWQQDSACPVKLDLARDSYYFLSKHNKYKIPNFIKPRHLHNKGCYIISLGALCRYLATKAEELGVEIFPSFAANKLLFNEDGKVVGVELGDFGLDKNNCETANYMPGAQLFSKYLLIAEGARGNIAKQAIEKFELDKKSTPQQYALAIKEIWHINQKHHKLGLAEHFIGYPNQRANSGGGFLYHIEDNKIAIGLITHLDYKNPYLSPYALFEKFKQHAKIQAILQNATRISYGARALSCGGYKSVPQITFPGGALLGCSAGFLNSARLKGIDNAISSGILCAKYVSEALKDNSDLADYNKNWKHSPIGQDLYKARNFTAIWHKFGLIIATIDLWCQELFNFSLFNKVTNKKPDYKKLACAKFFQNHLNIKKHLSKIADSLIYANLSSDDNQPNHLKVKNLALQENSELGLYGGPSMFYCPAAVYEWTKTADGKNKYVINAQNCLHCKTCDIKDPNQNIEWTCPQGGSGPNYQNM